MNENERQSFACGVLSRLNEAVIPVRRPARIGPWQPVRHSCHENVAFWVRMKPEHKHVIGFLVFDMSPFGHMKIAAHSLVEIEDGTLVDITPHGAEADYPFVRHIGTHKEFSAMVAAVETDVPLAALPCLSRG